MDHSDIYNHFSQRNIYGLEADASEAFKNLKDCMKSLGESEDSFFGLAAMIFHIFTDSTPSNKELVFIKHVYSNNGYDVDLERFKTHHAEARANAEDFIKHVVSFIAKNVDSGLKSFLGVLAISTAAVKGYIGAMDKIYHTEILDGWERYY